MDLPAEQALESVEPSPVPEEGPDAHSGGLCFDRNQLERVDPETGRDTDRLLPPLDAAVRHVDEVPRAPYRERRVVERVVSPRPTREVEADLPRGHPPERDLAAQRAATGEGGRGPRREADTERFQDPDGGFLARSSVLRLGLPVDARGRPAGPERELEIDRSLETRGEHTDAVPPQAPPCEGQIPASADRNSAPFGRYGPKPRPGGPRGHVRRGDRQTHFGIDPGFDRQGPMERRDEPSRLHAAKADLAVDPAFRAERDAKASLHAATEEVAADLLQFDAGGVHARQRVEPGHDEARDFGVARGSPPLDPKRLSWTAAEARRGVNPPAERKAGLREPATDLGRLGVDLGGCAPGRRALLEYSPDASLDRSTRSGRTDRGKFERPLALDEGAPHVEGDRRHQSGRRHRGAGGDLSHERSPRGRPPSRDAHDVHLDARPRGCVGPFDLASVERNLVEPDLEIPSASRSGRPFADERGGQTNLRTVDLDRGNANGSGGEAGNRGPRQAHPSGLDARRSGLARRRRQIHAGVPEAGLEPDPVDLERTEAHVSPESLREGAFDRTLDPPGRRPLGCRGGEDGGRGERRREPRGEPPADHSRLSSRTRTAHLR